MSVYVIHLTLQRGYLAGLRASFAPFASDGPIILLSYLVLDSFRHTPLVLAAISIVGGFYLATLAWRMFNIEELQRGGSGSPGFLTAVKINLLNPLAWMFWLTAGGAYLVKGSLAQAMVFVIFMLGTLGVTKFMLAASIRKLGERFEDRHYLQLLRLLALVLVGFAVRLVSDGFAHLGMI